MRLLGENEGSLSPDATEEEVAESIFASGISTTAIPTEISGRGVGMNAVRNFLLGVDGSIRAIVGEQSSDSNRFFFKLRMTLPLSR